MGPGAGTSERTDGQTAAVGREVRPSPLQDAPLGGWSPEHTPRLRADTRGAALEIKAGGKPGLDVIYATQGTGLGVSFCHLVTPRSCPFVPAAS